MLSSEVIQAINMARNFPLITRVGIFGSRARDEENADSDFDIIIDYDNCTDDLLENLEDFMEELERVITVKIDYVTYPALMRSKDSEFRESVLRDVLWVYNSKGGS